jgi:mono/diheme cytochrome c family protein
MTRNAPVLLFSFAFCLLGETGLAFAQDVDNGRRLSERWCSECHAIGPEPRKGLPSFPSIAAKESLTSDMITSFLLLPHATMPSPPLSRKDAQDIVAFIMKTKK